MMFIIGFGLIFIAAVLVLVILTNTLDIATKCTMTTGKSIDSSFL